MMHNILCINIYNNTCEDINGSITSAKVRGKNNNNNNT